MRNLSRFILGAIFAAYATLALALPFAPVSSTANGTHTCTNPTSRVAVGATITSPQTQVELQNTGTATVFFAWGDVTVTASASNYPVPAGQSKLITVGPTVTHIACFASTGSHTAHHTIGFGDS